jgi:uncharacterized RDD family membrane protein YckC
MLDRVLMLDTARDVPTPEGIELSLRLAGPVSRALAWLIDLVVRIAAIAVLGTALGILGGFGLGLMFILWFALEWLYPAAFEVWFGGATPGKRSLGLTVLHDDGTPVRLPASLTRNLLRAVDFLPFFYGFGLLSMLMSRDLKRLGDLAAGTVVVYREPAAQHAAVPLAPPVTPPVALLLAEQRAILDFATRSGALTEERAAELAALVPHLTGHRLGQGALQQLVGIANFLIGRRA